MAKLVRSIEASLINLWHKILRIESYVRNFFVNIQFNNELHIIKANALLMLLVSVTLDLDVHAQNKASAIVRGGGTEIILVNISQF